MYGILFRFLGPCGLTSLVTSDLHGSAGGVAISSISEPSLPLLCLTLLEREPTRARRRLFLLGLTFSALEELVVGGGVLCRGLACKGLMKGVNEHNGWSDVLTVAVVVVALFLAAMGQPDRA